MVSRSPATDIPKLVDKSDDKTFLEDLNQFEGAHHQLLKSVLLSMRGLSAVLHKPPASKLSLEAQRACDPPRPSQEPSHVIVSFPLAWNKKLHDNVGEHLSKSSATTSSETRLFNQFLKHKIENTNTSKIPRDTS